MEYRNSILKEKAQQMTIQAIAFSMVGAACMMAGWAWIITGRGKLLDNEQAPAQLVGMVPYLDIAAAGVIAVAILSVIRSVLLHRDAELMRQSTVEVKV